MLDVLAVEDALRLFAARDEASLGELRRAYSRYLGWRIERDRHDAAEKSDETLGSPPAPPPVLTGDMCWSRIFVPLFGAGSQPPIGDHEGPRSSRLDLAEIAKQVLAERAPDLELEQVRSGYKGRAVVRVRREMVRRMSAVGHRGRAIARYLRVSEQCVSNILRGAHRIASTPDA